MFDKLNAVEARYEQMLAAMADPALHADQTAYRTHARTLAELEPLVERFREYKTVTIEIAQTEELVQGDDAEMRELAAQELKTLEARRDTLLAEIKQLLIPKDPNDEKNVMLEIRAGTGGDEAALLAAELFRMYVRALQVAGGDHRVEAVGQPANAGALHGQVAHLGAAAARRVEVAQPGHRLRVQPTDLQHGPAA